MIVSPGHCCLVRRWRVRTVGLFAVLALAGGVFVGFCEPSFAADGGATGVGSEHPAPDAKGPFHIGTFRTEPAKPKADLPKGNADEGAWAPIKSRDGDGASRIGSASELLRKALLELEGNRLKLARRHLELLVAEYPNSVEANTARRHLARFYADIAPSKPAAPARVGLDEGMAPPPVVHKALSRALGLAVGDRVFFAPQSDKLGSKARRVLRGQAQWLGRRKRLGILVSGHADEPGSADDNVALAQRRAIAVRNRLIEEGVEQHRITTTALGRSAPIAKCVGQECSGQNRRVVTTILNTPSLRAPVKLPR